MNPIQSFLSQRTVDRKLEYENWAESGGDATLCSYQVEHPRSIPAAHVAWLRSLPLNYDDDLRHYVHAGVRPGVPLGAQSRDDQLWIRSPFLECNEQYERLVVHGHTPTCDDLPDLRLNRINLDTGAAFGGPLTAAIFNQHESMPEAFIFDK